jgi:hypothetical protein
LYFFLHKSWIWQTLGHFTKIFSYRHFQNASKECFWPKKFLNFIHRFKSAILSIFHFCQNGTFKPVREIRKKNWWKAFFWSIINIAIMIFSNSNSNCSNWLDLRILQEQVKKAFCYQKLFWPFTVRINCSCDLKSFEVFIDH